MGVHGLWDIVGVTARPVRVEALRNKKLAVDASIWIYQFMKAVRDSEGNQMKNAHIIGFFRRICKLIYFGIKPVFVFDGGVPALKRNTIRKRKEKREGNKETIEQTAQRILSKQLQEYAEGKLEGSKTPKKTKTTIKSSAQITEKPTSELYDVYYDDLVEEEDAAIEDEAAQEKEKRQEKESHLFKGQDDYDLPSIKEIKVDQNDNRLTTDYEYDRLTKDIQDDLDDIDLDNIDPQSPEFERLPLSTQYIVLSHLRLRSRLRMGYTKSQLQSLFPDPMEFSKFQIKMVQKRNFFTQKIMNVTGMDGDEKEEVVSRRIASDRNRAYNLKRTNDGFALSLAKEEIPGNNAKNPLVLNDIIPKMVPNASEILEADSESDVDWEDVNTDPKPAMKTKKSTPVVENALFVQDSADDDSVDESDDESVEMEDVTEANSGEVQTEDEVMKQIKYLYEYSDKNNKKSKNVVEKVIVDDEDMDDFHQMQLKQIEDEELKKAIAQSKKDYARMLIDEKSGNGNVGDLNDDQPIILSESTLSKTLKLPNLSMKNNLLFGGSKKKVKDKESVEENEKKMQAEEKKVSHPLPSWFTNFDQSEAKTSDSKKETLNPAPQMTEDEKAGLISYGEAGNYFSSDEEDEVVDADADPNPNVNSNATSNANIVEVINVDDDDNASRDEGSTIDEKVKLVQNPTNENFLNVKPETETSDNPIEEEKHVDSTYEATTAGNTDLREILNGETEKTVDNDEGYVFSDEEEVNLLIGMEEESQAYDNFVTSINGGNSNRKAWGIEEEAKFQEQLRKQKRDADEVTTNMIVDVQELLGRFGIPFITAPMEAEAQCAELKLIGLVDGIITDDSDCFLFGGERIYKNLFSDKHFVECYNQEDIKAELGLDREKLIELAILLGSDYTEGIKGVGKVTAMEILSEFESLANFRDWWIEYQRGKIDESSETPLRRKLRRKLKNLFLSLDFPNKLIYEAYLHPEVDHDKTPFKWGYPDLEKLRTYLQFNVGWGKEKVDEILLPVIKNMNKPQTSIEEFFPLEMIQRRRKLDMSKSIKDATEKLKSNKRARL